MRKVLFLALFLCIRLWATCQDDAVEKAGLLLPYCAYQPDAEMMVLRDQGDLSVNSDFNLRFDRQLTIKFFKEQKLDKAVSDIIFYQSSSLPQYTKLIITTIDLDQSNKTLIPRDVTARVTSTHLEQSGIHIKKGMLLKISYSISFPYAEKIPDWRFQFDYPVDYSYLKVSIPELMNLKTSLEGAIHPDVNTSTEVAKQVHLNSEVQPLKVHQSEYQFNQVLARTPEAFSDNSHREFEHLRFEVQSVTSEGKKKTGFAARQADKIVESLSLRPDYLLRMIPDFSVKADYDRRIRSITDPEEKLARIYDLVRRHITWDRVDTLSAKPLAKVWADKKGNSTEINLILAKLLEVYGYDVSPMIVSTRANGHIDTGNISLSDFDRTVACIKMGERHIVLDATARYFDYPMMSSAILNTTGLLISMDRNRWMNVTDDKTYYRNNVVLLGHLMGDTSFMTNVYVNSTGYAKAEHVEIYERDSLKGIRNYFERGNKSIHFKHFIVANEWVDTLPLAQEFDIRTPMNKNDNLCGVVPTWFSIPDTLFTIHDDRMSPVNFGYRQQYDLVSEYSFPERYEIYLMPNNMQMSAVNGSVHFEREYHNSTTSFSMKQSLVIDKTSFNVAEAIELAKFLKKIDKLTKQEVVLKRLY